MIDHHLLRSTFLFYISLYSLFTAVKAFEYYIFLSQCCMLMSLISKVLLFVQEVRFIVPVLKVNYGGPHSAVLN